ncbi:MAG: trehalose-6-phosphate synthase [Gemmatimonadetes bacterium]|nr:trehalose-6-phosphate synthase [Gemmatimonadota bacterium]
MADTGFVVVANRLPVRRIVSDGQEVMRISPGGLVRALRPVLQKHDSKWIGWTGRADDVVDPFEYDGICNFPVPISHAELRSFYDGFCNRTLWPLYHDSLRTPRFRRAWWDSYEQVNERFARAAADVARPDSMVWVHDYHLQLVPAKLRAMRPDLRIGFFLHIPFPPRELFATIPWRRHVLEGLLGADVVGLQTPLGALNFVQLARRFTTAKRRKGRVEFNGRSLVARAFPISIDVRRFEAIAAREDVRRHAEEFRRRTHGRRIILGVDRLDYTKGIDNRLRAYARLLRSGQVNPADVVFVQIAVPSRERVAEYRELKARVDRLVGEINGAFAELGRPAVHYVRRSYPAPKLVALYLAADVLAVTPFRDGMNLVAKEYVAVRTDRRGVLLLSEFSGAVRELNGAVLVNPHDEEGVTLAMRQALEMTGAEQARRMRRMQRALKRNTVFDWADDFLAELS